VQIAVSRCSAIIGTRRTVTWMPCEDPWPEAMLDKQLGESVKNMRSYSIYNARDVPERRQWLDEHGFKWKLRQSASLRCITGWSRLALLHLFLSSHILSNHKPQFKLPNSTFGILISNQLSGTFLFIWLGVIRGLSIRGLHVPGCSCFLLLLPALRPRAACHCLL
jgi:hypothetical protein